MSSSFSSLRHVASLFFLTLFFFFVLAEGAHDEGPNGPLRVPGDSGGSSEGEG